MAAAEAGRLLVGQLAHEELDPADHRHSTASVSRTGAGDCDHLPEIMSHGADMNVQAGRSGGSSVPPAS